MILYQNLPNASLGFYLIMFRYHCSTYRIFLAAFMYIAYQFICEKHRTEGPDFRPIYYNTEVPV